MKTLVATVSMVLALATATHARELPPEGSDPKPFTLPEKQRITLDNGIPVTLVPFGSVPKVTLVIQVRTGNLNEGGDVWLADLAGTLLTEGTENLTALEIAERAANMGGQVGVAVGPEFTTLSLDVLGEFAPEAAALLAEVLLRPTFPESELDRVRGDYLRSLSVARTRPQALASEAFARLMYGDHTFGTVYPTEAQLEAYTIDQVRTYYAENFGAKRTAIYASGQFDAAALGRAMETHFGDWTAGPEVVTDIPTPSRTRRVELIDRPDAPQSTIYLGVPVADPSNEVFLRLRFMNTILGGYFSSRITSNIREDKGYTYSPRSNLSTRYRDAVWRQTADVTTNVTGPALKEIYFEVDRLRETAPEADEMTRTRNYMNGRFVLSNATRTGIISQLAFMDIHGLPEDHLETYVDRLGAITAEDVRKTAADFLDPAEMTLVVVGDKTVTLEQLSQLPELEGVDFE